MAEGGGRGRARSLGVSTASEAANTATAAPRTELVGAAVPKMKPRPCAHCQSSFTPARMGQRVCGVVCSMRLVKADKIKERAETKARKEKAKTNGERKAEAQAALNRWVVHVRDKDQPCISCGRFHTGANQGGHYRSRGSAPHLALDPRNVHRQCAPCNVHLHGNLLNMRMGLVARYGVEFVEALEVDQGPRHYSPQDLEAIKADYTKRLREAKKEKE